MLREAVGFANPCVPTLRVDLSVFGLERFDRNCFSLLTRGRRGWLHREVMSKLVVAVVVVVVVVEHVVLLVQEEGLDIPTVAVESVIVEPEHAVMQASQICVGHSALPGSQC